MNIAVLSLAFGAGAAIFFSPCGVALLPSYISFLLAKKENAGTAKAKAFEGLKIGVTVSLGMVSVFAGLGILVSLFGNFLASYAFWFGTVTGSALIILGIMFLFGKSLHIPMPRIPTEKKSSLKAFYLFGIGYATGGIACTLPAFLLVVFSALGSRTFFGGFMNFIAFSAAAVILMIFFTTLSAVAKTLVSRWINKYVSLIQKISAFIIIIGGAYLIWFNVKAFILL